MVKNPPANAGDIRDTGPILGSGRSPGGEQGKGLQYSCLENPMDRGAWWLQSMGSKRVRHNWSNLAPTHATFSYDKNSQQSVWRWNVVKHNKGHNKTSPGEGNDNPLQYSCLENYKDRGVWWATVHGVTKSWMWLSTHTTTWRKKRVEVGARFLNICLFVSFWFLDFVKKKNLVKKRI